MFHFNNCRNAHCVCEWFIWQNRKSALLQQNFYFTWKFEICNNYFFVIILLIFFQVSEVLIWSPIFGRVLCISIWSSIIGRMSAKFEVVEVIRRWEDVDGWQRLCLDKLEERLNVWKWKTRMFKTSFKIAVLQTSANTSTRYQYLSKLRRFVNYSCMNL